jgi:hypothetical protein
MIFCGHLTDSGQVKVFLKCILIDNYVKHLFGKQFCVPLVTMVFEKSILKLSHLESLIPQE